MKKRLTDEQWWAIGAWAQVAGVAMIFLAALLLLLAGCGSVETTNVDAGGGAGGRGGAGGADVGGRGGAELGGRGGDVGQGGAAAGTTGSAGTGGASCTPATPTNYSTCGPPICQCQLGQPCPPSAMCCRPDQTRTCSCGGTCGPCPSLMSVGGQGCPANATTNPGSNRLFGCVWNGAAYLGCVVHVHDVTGQTVFLICDADCS